MSSLDYEKILNIYWPVIEACQEIQADYLGKLPNKHKDKPRIAPDSVGHMINMLIQARLKMPIKREIVQIEESDLCQQQ